MQGTRMYAKPKLTRRIKKIVAVSQFASGEKTERKHDHQSKKLERDHMVSITSPKNNMVQL